MIMANSFVLSSVIGINYTFKKKVENTGWGEIGLELFIWKIIQ